MAITDAYLRQHAELAELMRAVAGKLDETVLATSGAREARDLLSRLASQNEEISIMASQFQKEMGGLKQAFESYYGRWNSVAAIQSDPAGFIGATGKILEALGKRVDRENTYLYPLADRL